MTTTHTDSSAAANLNITEIAHGLFAAAYTSADGTRNEIGHFTNRIKAEAAAADYIR